jgi:hypothetical protein
MASNIKTAGVVEVAVKACHPTTAVLFEASALDRELKNPERSWEALLRAIESFATHYPAVLLKSPPAMMELGRACLIGVRQAPGAASRTKAAELLGVLLSGVTGEVMREGAEGIGRQVPDGMRLLMEELRPQPGVLWEHGRLFPSVQTLGRQVLLVAEDSSHPEAWYGLLDVLTELLLDMSRKKVEGEPAYDGRWDRSKAADLLEVGSLDAVRRERLDADLAWFADLKKDLLAGKRPGVDVFLELSVYASRDERESAWGAWFQAVTAKALAGELSAGMLRKLCMGIADQIEQVRDRRFLAKLAAIVRRVVPEVAAANGEAGLRTALNTCGRAIVLRLEREAGCGDVDAAFLDLQAGVGELVQRLLDRAECPETSEALDLGIRARTGPMRGHPVGCEDVVWRLTLAAGHPQVAEKLLLSLLSGFCLEDVLLRDHRRPGGLDHSVAPKGTPKGAAPMGTANYAAKSAAAQTAGESLAGLLGRSWEPHLRHLVRAVLRVAPLSPFHVGGATTRAHLLALDPEDRQDSYLYDLKERILSRAGLDNIVGVESVLCFWRTGEAAHLDGLISPESLAALPNQARDSHVEHIRTLIDGLSRHVPVEGGRDKAGVRWLAGMPETFYETGTLLKVAGFSGCSRQAVSLLSHLLQLYRSLVKKYEPADRAVSGSPGTDRADPDNSGAGDGDGDGGAEPEDLMKRSRRFLKQRRDLFKRMFVEGGPEEVEPIRHLESFDRELAVVRREDGCLEELANRTLGILDRNRLPLAGEVLGHMITHACLSGLGTQELQDIGTGLSDGQFVESEFFSLLSRVACQVASTRNRLAECLQPHVEDSAKRLLTNPLSRPAPAYQGLFVFHHHRGADRLAIELGDALIEDLLSADGSFLLLEDFIHRLRHLIEMGSGNTT